MEELNSSYFKSKIRNVKLSEEAMFKVDIGRNLGLPYQLPKL